MLQLADGSLLASRLVFKISIEVVNLNTILTIRIKTKRFLTVKLRVQRNNAAKKNGRFRFEYFFITLKYNKWQKNIYFFS